MKEKVNKIDDDIVVEEIEAEDENIDLPIEGSPLYPRVFVGDSAKPLQGQFNQSEYVDDNISRTWTGLLTSYYG